MTSLDEAIRETWKFCYDTYPDGEGEARALVAREPESEVVKEELKSEDIIMTADIKERIMKAYWDGYYKGFRDGQSTGE